jgi:hypothetical protein
MAGKAVSVFELFRAVKPKCDYYRFASLLEEILRSPEILYGTKWKGEFLEVGMTEEIVLISKLGRLEFVANMEFFPYSSVAEQSVNFSLLTLPQELKGKTPNMDDWNFTSTCAESKTLEEILQNLLSWVKMMSAYKQAYNYEETPVHDSEYENKPFK